MNKEKEFKYVNVFDGYGKLKTDSLYPKILFTNDEINKYDLIGQLEELQQENQLLKEQRQELRSWLEEMLDDENDIFSVVRVRDVLSKLNELKGGKNEIKQKEIDMIISAIDLIIQWYGTTKELEALVDKLLKMKEGIK